MKPSDRSSKRLVKHPGAFALAVIKQFRANQGVLLAGAVAYYTLLSLVPRPPRCRAERVPVRAASDLTLEIESNRNAEVLARSSLSQPVACQASSEARK